VYLDIASRRSAEYIRKRLPSMYHQFKELADVDITATPMEVGPTLHYIMGGVRVEPETAASTVPGLFAAGEVAGGMHGSNRLGGNSLSDLLVFGRRAGAGAAAYAGRTNARSVDRGELDEAAQVMLAPFEAKGGENPYALHAELQETMQNLVGIIRREDELELAIVKLDELELRAARVTVEGNRQFNPGWHLALDLHSMITVSQACARSALMRTESRGGHTREDHPKSDPEWGKKNVVTRKRDGLLELTAEPLPPIPEELRQLVLSEEKQPA
jgi:succinate dehydrogenase / fumarate reductase flavoprotein subunit